MIVKKVKEKFDLFHKGYKQLHNMGLPNYKLWEGIVELILRYDLKRDDISIILNDYDNEFDRNKFLSLAYKLEYYK